MRTAYNKPHLTFVEQVKLLRSRGMIIPDQTKATMALKAIGYYRLSGYWYSFRQINAGFRTEKFISGTNINDIIDLYFFDKKLRMLLFDALECIEINIRVVVAHEMSAVKKFSYDNSSFFNPIFLTPDSNGFSLHHKWLEKFNKNVQRSKNEYIVKHYESKYLPPMPIWIAVQIWDFGMLSHFFSGLKSKYQQQIARVLSIPKGIYLQNWLHCLNDIRNLAAHHCRIWNHNFVTQPRLPQKGEIDQLDHLTLGPINRIYPCCCIMAYILENNFSFPEWKTSFRSHIKTFPNLRSVNVADMGFPLDWENQVIWQNSAAT